MENKSIIETHYIDLSFENMIMIADPNILILRCFELCEKGRCEYCLTPSSDIYSFPCGTYEYPESSCICGKCVVENQKKNHGNFNSMDLPESILPF